MDKQKKNAYIMMIASMLVFSTIGIFRRYIPLSSSLLAFARGILGAFSLLIFCIIKKIKFNPLKKKTLLLLVLTGAIIGINWILLFESYNKTSVSIATLCYYMQPTILIFLSPIIFKEKLSLKKIISAAFALIGMVFISGIFDAIENISLSGIIFGLGAAVFYTFAVVFNKLIELDDPYEKTIIELFSASVVLIPYLLLSKGFEMPIMDVKSIIMVLVVGIVHTGIAYAMYFSSIKKLPAQSIAILGYIDPVGALVLSFAILNEKLSIYGIIGAVLIIGSAILCEINISKNKKV